MRRIACLLIITSTLLACNLSSQPPRLRPTSAPDLNVEIGGIATATDEPPPFSFVTLTSRPTLPPLPGLPPTSPVVTSQPSLGATCDVYTTYSGVRADNVLSLRDGPSTEALQLYRVPNNAPVLRVPGSAEIEAEGYHWLNVIYEESPQQRIQGWIARDSFEVNGERDPSVATLRPTGSQAAC